MTDLKQKILVWDAPVRVVHWLMVLSFAGAYLTAESERWRLIHVTLGYTLGGLVLFRLLWGLIGTRYARFASFVRGRAAVLRYLRALISRQPEHHVGHNPAGALAIVALLFTSAVVVFTGWANYQELGGEWLAEVHEISANIMLAIVAVHVLGVVLASWQHRENLVRAMLTGNKDGEVGQGIHRAWGWLAVLIVLAVLGFWYLQWQSAPGGPAADVVPSADHRSSVAKRAESS